MSHYQKPPSSALISAFPTTFTCPHGPLSLANAARLGLDGARVRVHPIVRVESSTLLSFSHFIATIDTLVAAATLFEGVADVPAQAAVEQPATAPTETAAYPPAFLLPSVHSPLAALSVPSLEHSLRDELKLTGRSLRRDQRRRDEPLVVSATIAPATAASAVATVAAVAGEVQQEGRRKEGEEMVKVGTEVEQAKKWTLEDRDLTSLRLTLKRHRSDDHGEGGGGERRRRKILLIPSQSTPPPPSAPIPPPALPPSRPPGEGREARKARLHCEKAEARAADLPRRPRAAHKRSDPSLPLPLPLPSSPAQSTPTRFPPTRGGAEDSDAELLASAARHAADLSRIPFAPVLTPTAAEFADPMGYIRGVVSAYERYGVVVVKPPEGWRPSYEYKLEEEEGFACKRQVLRRYTERQRREHWAREGRTSEGGGRAEGAAGGVEQPLHPFPLTHLEQTAMQVSAFPFSASMTLQQFTTESERKQTEWERLNQRWQAKAKRCPSPPPLPGPLAAAEDAYWRWAMYYGRRQLPAVLYANDVDTTPAHRTPLSPTLSASASSSSSPSFSPSPLLPFPTSSPFTSPPAPSASPAAASRPSLSSPSPSPSPAPFHPWELSSLNLLPSGILHHLDRVIPGITAPMLYIGMSFSTFCWHHEDHHLYSISYNHRGQPKTWYGVPGSHCQAVEDIARRHLYPFFDHDREHILARKTSMFSPTLLSGRGVPVYRAEQGEGTFAITFPRAYHSGFSHGFSLAESVNFALDDWMEAGYEATVMYRRIGRFPVVPYAELIMKMVERVVGSVWGVVGEGVQGGQADDLTVLRRLERCVSLLVWDELRERDRLYGRGRHAKLRLRQQTGGRRETRYCDQCSHAAYFSIITCGCEGEVEGEVEGLCLGGHGLCRMHKQEGSVVRLAYSSLELTTVVSDVQRRLVLVEKRRAEREVTDDDREQTRVRNGRFDACLALATELSDREAMVEEVYREDDLHAKHRAAQPPQMSGPSSPTSTPVELLRAVPVAAELESSAPPSPEPLPSEPVRSRSPPRSAALPALPPPVAAVEACDACPALPVVPAAPVAERPQTMLAFLIAEIKRGVCDAPSRWPGTPMTTPIITDNNPSPPTPLPTQLLA